MEDHLGWDAYMAKLLRVFVANPEGTVAIPVRDAIEWARNARDFEIIVAAAPHTHGERLARAVELVRQVVGHADAPDKLREVCDDLAAIADSYIQAEAVTPFSRPQPNGADSPAHDPEGPPPPDPEFMAGVLTRATVPRHVLLAQQRMEARARAANEGESSGHQQADEKVGEVP